MKKKKFWKENTFNEHAINFTNIIINIYIDFKNAIQSRNPKPTTNPMMEWLTFWTSNDSHARQEEHHRLCLLPGTVCGCHIHDTDPTTNFVLFFQFNRTLRPDIIDGFTRIYTTSWFGWKAHLRYVYLCVPITLSFTLINKFQTHTQTNTQIYTSYTHTHS